MKWIIPLISLSLSANTQAADMTNWSDKTVCRLQQQFPNKVEYAEEASNRQLDCFAKPKQIGYYKVENGTCDQPYQTRDEQAESYSDFVFYRHFEPKSDFKLPAYRYTGHGLDPAGHAKGGSVSPEIKGVADLNNDGIDDLWIEFYESDVPSMVLYGQKNGEFIKEEHIPLEAARRHIRNGEIADINNDGWLDLIGFTTGDPGFRFKAEGYDIGNRHIPRGQANLLLVNQQGKGFRHQKLPEIRRNDWNHGGSAGDINGDGWIDILPLSEGERERTVPLINQGAGKFKLNSSEYSKLISTELTSDMDAADLNNDGIDDIAIIIRPKGDSSYRAMERFGSIRVIYGDNDTKMSNNQQLKFGHSWLTAEDESLFTQYGEGDPVLAGARASGSHHEVIVGNSNVEILDVNGDNRPDILEGFFVTNTGLWQTTGFKVYINQGDCFTDGTAEHFPNQITNRSFHENHDWHTNYIHNFRMGDVNNDGYLDLVLQVDGHSDYLDAKPQGFPYLFINDGNNHYLPPKVHNVSAITQRQDDLVPGDFNGDGLTDIVSILGKHEDIPLVRLFTQKAKPDNEDRIYPNTQLGSISNKLYARIERLITSYHQRDVTRAELTQLSSGYSNVGRKQLNGQYRMTWYMINIGPSGGYQIGASDIVAITDKGMKLVSTGNGQPSQHLRKKLSYSINDEGQFRIKGELDLFGGARSYETEILGHLHNRIGLGIWHDGDPMIVMFEPIQ